MNHGQHCIDGLLGRPACGDPVGHEEWRKSRYEDQWVPAGGGTEVPFTKNGRSYLYVWNAAEQRHGVLDLATDIVIDDLEFYDRFGRS